MRYRVFCNFVVEADSHRGVLQFLSEDADFVEKHIIIGNDSPASKLLPYHSEEEVYANITSKERGS